jgi:uncharacterized circularly permuted ATP-grasp superfamily protein
MSQHPYDEVLDATGDLRKPVGSFRARNSAIVTQPSTEMVRQLTDRPLGDSGRILPIPLVLADHEYMDVISPGAAQRALALQRLFHDLFAGDRTIVERRRLFDHDFVRHVVAREGWSVEALTRIWTGRRLDDVRFVYGPDLLRGPDGNWLLLEDNVGCVGGMADARSVLRRYLEASGTSLHPTIPLPDDLRGAVVAFLDRAGVAVDDPDLIGFAGQSPGPGVSGTYSEAARKSAALADVGVRVRDPEDLRAPDGTGASPPSAVVNLGGTGSGELGATVVERFAGGGLSVLNGPGVGVLGSKAFLPVLPDAIRYYLDDEPVLATPPTVFPDPLPLPNGRPLVVKRVDGCGGSDVFVLGDLGDIPAVRRREVERLVASWGPNAAVAQEFVEGSVIAADAGDGPSAFRVEVRPLVYVVGAGVARVGATLWGRATPATADHPGNLTRGSRHLAVLREPVA